MATTENVESSTKSSRKIVSYEPKGLPSELLAAELRVDVQPGNKPPKGALAKILSAALVAFLGPKYPNIVAKFPKA